MKNRALFTVVVLTIACHFSLFAQEKSNVKFGKIDAGAFTLPDEEYLKGADAVYLADIGKSQFVGNSKGWFTLEFKRHVRIKIVNNNGFDAADFEVPLYYDGGNGEKLYQLKGVTYNLENGQVVETPLKNDQVFLDKKNKNQYVKKFTLPGVKVGSIIDVEYLVTSDFFFNLQPWNFQGKYPRLWSEYEVLLPEFFRYVFLGQGNGKYHISKQGEAFQTYNLVFGTDAGRSASERIDSRVLTQRWVVKDVPALKQEPFTSALSNHIMNVNFQLSRIQFDFQTTPMYEMGTWGGLVDRLNKNDYFGANLNKNNNWLDDDIKQVLGNAKDTLEMAKKIFAYIRDNFTCTDSRAIYTENVGLKGVLKAKKGNAADLNLLLISMLQHQKIEAYPLILSTKEHGYVSNLYPVLSKFNLTVAVAIINNQEYFLDASNPLLGFGKLSDDCYNGFSCVVAGSGIPVYLVADSLRERKITSLIILQEENGGWKGVVNSNLGYYESLSLRNKMKSSGKESILKSMQTALGEMQIEEPEFINVDEKDEPVKIKYRVDLKASADEDLRYLNPMMGEGYTENPFKSAERYYPVEMPYAMDETFVAMIDVPIGYTVDEVPKSARVKLNDDEGMFEYLVSNSGDKIQLRSRIMINKANFLPEDYQTLRDFFSYVVKKHSEQIVFKKKA